MKVEKKNLENKKKKLGNSMEIYINMERRSRVSIFRSIIGKEWRHFMRLFQGTEKRKVCKKEELTLDNKRLS